MEPQGLVPEARLTDWGHLEGARFSACSCAVPTLGSPAGAEPWAGRFPGIWPGELLEHCDYQLRDEASKGLGFVTGGVSHTPYRRV